MHAVLCCTDIADTRGSQQVNSSADWTTVGALGGKPPYKAVASAVNPRSGCPPDTARVGSSDGTTWN